MAEGEAARRPAVLVDLDGTLALIGDRSPYDADLCERDAVNPAVAAVVGWARAAGHAVVLVTGRGFSATHRPATERWLARNGIGYDLLLMREPGDGRPDHRVKAQIYRQRVRDGYDVLFVLDDRPEVVDMWRTKFGLTVFQVAG